MPRVPEEVHVRLVLDDAGVEAVRKIRRLLSDLSDALSVFAPDDPDTGQPDMETRLASGQLSDTPESPDNGQPWPVYRGDYSYVRVSDPDAPKADPDSVHPVLRPKPDSGQTAGQIVQAEDIGH